MKIFHTADWHLNSQATFNGSIVRNEAGVNLRWQDQMDACRRFVDSVVEQQPDLVVIAGDLLDSSRPTITDLVCSQQILSELSNMAPTIVIPGNHDPATGEQPSPVAALELRHPYAHLMLRPYMCWMPFACVACLPFPSRSMLLSKDEMQGKSHEEVNALLSAALRSIVRSIRAQCKPGLPAILVSHLPVIGASMNAGQVVGQEHVSLTTEDLQDWDLVLLGDLHMRQQVSENAFYPGVLTRQNFGEETYPTGYLIHTLDGDEHSAEQVDIPSREWCSLTPKQLGDPELDFSRYPNCVYRVKGTVTQAEYDALQPDLARWRQHPLFSEALTVERQTRARSVEQTGELSPELALAQWARDHGMEDQLAELLAAHGEIAQ